MSKKIYSDECGGEFNVNVKRWRAADPHCDHKPGYTHQKIAYKVSVSTGKRTLWAPKAPMCVLEHRRRNSDDALASQAMGFFENNRCTRGNVKSGPLKTSGQFEGAKRRKRRK